jgi:hypothetical protein
MVGDIDGDVLGDFSTKESQVSQQVDWMIRAIVVLSKQYRSCLLISDANHLQVRSDPEFTLNTAVESSMQLVEFLDGISVETELGKNVRTIESI